MKIVVKFGAPLSQVIGETKTFLSMPAGSTVADALDELRGHYPDFDEGLRGKGLRRPFDQILYSLFVNTRPVSFDQASSVALSDGDRIYLFLPVAGG
jgi:molybdopterin converting factor small subunit